MQCILVIFSPNQLLSDLCHLCTYPISCPLSFLSLSRYAIHMSSQTKIRTNKLKKINKSKKIKTRNTHTHTDSMVSILCWLTLGMELPWSVVDAYNSVSSFEKLIFLYPQVSVVNSVLLEMGPCVSTSSQCWDGVWLQPVQVLSVLPWTPWGSMCIHPIVLENSISLQSSTTSGS